MLGMFSLLPLLKGWDYKQHVAIRAVNRGVDPIEVLRISETGWLVDIAISSYDVYGYAVIDYQGADLQTRGVTSIIEDAYTAGAFTQDPAGGMQRYFRPNPYSTAGIYVGVVFSGGYQGSAWPYAPTIVVKLGLLAESTQLSTTVAFSSTTIAITNKSLFIRSLRRVLDANASLKIDPALLSVGPIELAEVVK